MGISIVWDSYDEKGRLRSRPPASTIHGWLVKMRGTLVGNESMRRKGIREMEQARLERKKRRAKRRTGCVFPAFRKETKPTKKRVLSRRGHRPERSMPGAFEPNPVRPKTKAKPRPHHRRSQSSRRPSRADSRKKSK